MLTFPLTNHQSHVYGQQTNYNTFNYISIVYNSVQASQTKRYINWMLAPNRLLLLKYFSGSILLCDNCNKKNATFSFTTKGNSPKVKTLNEIELERSRIISIIFILFV